MEKMTSPVATLWSCFQDVQKRFSVSRKCLIFSFWKMGSKRVSVCRATVAFLQLKLLPALHLARELLLCIRWLWRLCRFVLFALRGRLHAGGSRQCAELADPRTGRLHSIQVSVRIEKYKWNSNLIQQRCVPQVLMQAELLNPAGDFGLSQCTGSWGLLN